MKREIPQLNSSTVEEPLTVSLQIYGMSCSNCAAGIERGLAEQTGVTAARINFALEQLQVSYLPSQTGVEQIRDRVRELGFRASRPSLSAATGELLLGIGGMSCASCVGRVEKCLAGLPGVRQVSVNLATEQARLSFDPERLTLRQISEAVEGAGYQAVMSETVVQPGGDRELAWLIFAALFSLPILPLMGWQPFGRFNLPMIALLATMVQFSAGLTFYRGAYSGLRNRSANMDLLVALGISAAYGYSLLSWSGIFGPGAAVFFETGALLVTFVRCGKWLEARAKGKAGKALRQLLDLQPQTACLLVGGREKEIPAQLLEVDDLLLVRAGEKIPVDGRIEEGEAAVDEALLTGESVPVAKSSGHAVTAGTIDLNGRLLVRATRVGEETSLAGIVRLVSEAQADKAPIQRLADRLANVFVPAVVTISLLTLGGWLLAGSPFLFAFRNAVAVLVIACPCALGLATPTAIMVGSGIGLRRGILFKRASVLEQVAQLQTIIFDKTGTLTSGAFEVLDVLPVKAGDEQRLLGSAAALEQASGHPLALAIEAAAQESGLVPEKVTDFHELGGRGLSGRLGDAVVLVGNAALLEEQGIATAPLGEQAERFAAEGKTLVFVSRAGEFLGLLALADSLQSEAVGVIADLRRRGLHPVLLSGDRTAAVAAVAARLGIDDLVAEVRPEEKLEVVRRYQQQGRRVAMVGDGINDAPALAQADIGIAMGSGTDVAKETGDLVLVGGDLRKVVAGIELGNATLQKIRQNLFWAFIYNLIGLPLAAGLFYPWFGLLLKPEFAGLAMAFSSVSVVSNSLLLQHSVRRLPGWRSDAD